MKAVLGKFKELIIVNPTFSKYILRILGRSNLPVSTLTILRDEYDPAFYNCKGKNLDKSNGIALRNIEGKGVFIEKEIITHPTNPFKWVKKLFYPTYNVTDNRIIGYDTDLLSIGNDNDLQFFATIIEDEFILSSLVNDAVYSQIDDSVIILIEPNNHELDLIKMDLSGLIPIIRVIVDKVNQQLPESLQISDIRFVKHNDFVRSKTGKIKKYFYRGPISESMTVAPIKCISI